jgi:hypothetical protein
MIPETGAERRPLRAAEAAEARFGARTWRAGRRGVVREVREAQSGAGKFVERGAKVLEKHRIGVAAPRLSILHTPLLIMLVIGLLGGEAGARVSGLGIRGRAAEARTRVSGRWFRRSDRMESALSSQLSVVSARYFSLRHETGRRRGFSKGWRILAEIGRGLAGASGDW